MVVTSPKKIIINRHGIHTLFLDPWPLLREKKTVLTSEAPKKTQLRLIFRYLDVIFTYLDHY